MHLLQRVLRLLLSQSTIALPWQSDPAAGRGSRSGMIRTSASPPEDGDRSQRQPPTLFRAGVRFVSAFFEAHAACDAAPSARSLSILLEVCMAATIKQSDLLRGLHAHVSWRLLEYSRSVMDVSDSHLASLMRADLAAASTTVDASADTTSAASMGEQASVGCGPDASLVAGRWSATRHVLKIAVELLREATEPDAAIHQDGSRR